MISRDEVLLEYLEKLQYPPYPVQEQALYAWAECDQGVLLCAPTGTGKTLVAEGAVYEAMRTGKYIYYSTPLIALTDQKFLELQATVKRWGFDPDRVGLVTGHRTVNPNAQVKVVVAEVLLNRLLHQEMFSFDDVGAVIMDEFHSFNEPQRGIVWELSLSLLPKHVRVMLLSATVGSPNEFINWMARSLERRVTLVEGKERKVPLTFTWIGDELLPDFLEQVAKGPDEIRKTPALVFCFDRELCWATADLLKGKDLFADGQRQALFDRIENLDFSVGSGNKIKALLNRGIGIHHAGLLPRYRRVVETLFQEKLLPICVCTETLAAGLNLPARSVVLTTLVKGPRDKKKLIEVGSAQQMFGRAGRPQFDAKGFVFALSHEDDVKLARWQEKYDAIPEDAKDPKLMSAKKALLKKKPTRRQGVAYWNPDQFTKLQTSASQKLSSKGGLSWRWLAYLLDLSPLIDPIQRVIKRRLMDSGMIQAELKRLTKMLVTLHEMGMLVLDPAPPESWRAAVKPAGGLTADGEPEDDSEEAPEPEKPTTDFSSQQDVNKLLGQLKLGNLGASKPLAPILVKNEKGGKPASGAATPGEPEPYEPITATPTPKLKEMMVFRAVHPLYGVFLMDYLGLADKHELIQVMESLLEMPGSVAKAVRVPWPQNLPPGRMTMEVVDPAMLTSGLASQDDMYPPPPHEQGDLPPELRKYPIPLAQKMRMLFESKIDHAGGLFVTPVWAIGDLIDMGGNFDNFVKMRELLKQEGVIFKHVLRMILLCDEFAQLTPAGIDPEVWKANLKEISDVLTTAARAVDPQCTDEMLEEIAEGP
jgi:superfamily II DNA/RNA helicase